MARMYQLNEFVPYAFPFFFAGISFALGRMSGWQRLAERYRIQGPFGGRRWWLRSALMGPERGVSYGGVLILGVGPDGFYMAVLLPFRVGHPPMLIPWRDVRVGPRTTEWRVEYVTWLLGTDDPVPFKLDARTADKLIAAAGAHAPRAA